LKAKYPTLILHFIPAGCTPVLQPLDVGVHRSFKSRIRRRAMEWLSVLALEQFRERNTDVAVPTKLTQLKEPFVKIVAGATRWLQHSDQKEMIIKAWAKPGLLVAWEETKARDLLVIEAIRLQDKNELFDSEDKPPE